MAIRYIVNPGGPTLGLDSGSGLGTIVQDGLTFKDFDRSGQVLLEAVSGAFDFTGRLPMQMPKNMETVEAHCEDLPFDLACYTDAQGHVWDFGYGLSLHGVLDSAVSDIYR